MSKQKPDIRGSGTRTARTALNTYKAHAHVGILVLHSFYILPTKEGLDVLELTALPLPVTTVTTRAYRLKSHVILGIVLGRSFMKGIGCK